MTHIFIFIERDTYRVSNSHTLSYLNIKPSGILC